MQETRVQSLAWKDPLEKEMATHSSIVAWEIPRTEEPSGLQSTGLPDTPGSLEGNTEGPGTASSGQGFMAEDPYLSTEDRWELVVKLPASSPQGGQCGRGVPTVP